MRNGAHSLVGRPTQISAAFSVERHSLFERCGYFARSRGQGFLFESHGLVELPGAGMCGRERIED
jgi:hypothetical protein